MDEHIPTEQQFAQSHFTGGSIQTSDEIPTVGSILLGRYQIFGIRQGGFGIVYFVENIQTHQEFAIKTIRPEFAALPSIVERFKAEAEFWINIHSHPNIVGAYLIELLNDLPCLFLEYVNGGAKTNLRDWLHGGKLDTQQALNFAYQLCSAMEFANQKTEVAHLDLKPENILIDRNGVLKVSDFGSANIVRVVRDHYPTINIGTWPYTAPEIFLQGTFSSQSDIYSFGIILYEMLTGKLPYPAELLTDDPKDQFNRFSRFHKELGANKLSELLENDSLIPAKDVLVGCVTHFRRFRSFTDVKSVLETYMHSVPPEITHHYSKSDTDWYRQAISLHNLGRYSEALSIYNRLLSQDPNSAKLWFFAALCLGNVGLTRDAHRFVERALEIDPTLEPAMELLRTLKGQVK